MAGKKDIAFKITADDSDFKRALKSTTNTLDSAVRKASKYAAVAGAAAAGGMAIIGKQALQAASDMEETQGKFNVVFRGMTAEAETWAETLRQSYAMSESESKKYLSSIQDLVVPTGMARDAAGEMSNKFVQLAADLGSFNNRDTQDVIRDIQSALQGSSETMAKYGINVKAAKVEQEIYRLGLAKTKDEITDAHKVQAIYNIAMREGADAVGDMARTYGSFANQQKQFTATMDDMKVALGQEILPIASEIITQFNSWASENDNLKNTINVLVEVLKAAGEAIYALGAGLGIAAAKTVEFVENTGRALDQFKNKVKNEAGGAWDWFKGKVTAPVEAVVDFMATGSTKRPFTEKVAELLGVFGVFVADTETPIETNVDATAFSEAVTQMGHEFITFTDSSNQGMQGMQDNFGVFSSTTSATATELTNLLTGEFESFGDAFNNVLDSMIDAFINAFAEMAASNAIEGLVGMLGGLIPGASGVTGFLSEIPIVGDLLGGVGSFLGGIFADGGTPNAQGLAPYRNTVVSQPTIFPFASGGALGLMGEAGSEAIMPLTRTSSGDLGVKADGSSQVIENHITVMLDGKVIKSTVDKHIVDRGRRGVADNRRVTF